MRTKVVRVFVMLTVVGGIAYLGVILIERRVLHYLPARAAGGNL